MASTGRIEDARQAGYNPAKHPTTAEPSNATSITCGVIATIDPLVPKSIND